jgi:putative phosphoesterase
MKIGLLADVHASLAPLQKALALFEAQGVEMILCAGDLVDRGIEGDAVVDLLRQRQIPCVLGNHDEDTSQYQLKVYQRLAKHELPEFFLKLPTLEYLATLPMNLYFSIENKSICLTHGTPSNNFDYIYPDSSRYLCREVLREAKSDIVIAGHSHMPMRIWVNSKYILNPGSVYRNRTPDQNQTCGILTLPGSDFQVYDLKHGRTVEYPEVFFDEEET